MEVYTLDSAFRHSAVIDSFESFIWTERFAAYGDFEMVIASTIESQNLLAIGTRLSILASYRVMTVETVVSKIDSEGKRFLTITGRSLEALLEDRVAKETMSNLIDEPKWIITGTPGAIVRSIFQKICVDGTLAVADIIPFVVPGNLFPADTIAEPLAVVKVRLDVTTVYGAIKEICDYYKLGFRLVRNLETSQLNFNIYAGSDRTTAQTVLPSVVFGQDLDTLDNISELSSMAQHKNVAYVFSPNGFAIVYAAGYDSTTAGFVRRVLMVKADDVNDVAGTELTAILLQRGQDELSKNRSVFAFDGEIPKYSVYSYGDAYQLGDLLEMRNSNGVIKYIRVTEQIFVSDSEGDRSYPTLAADVDTTPGSWSGDLSTVWDTADGSWSAANGVWSEA